MPSEMVDAVSHWYSDMDPIVVLTNHYAMRVCLGLLHGIYDYVP